MKRFLLPLAGIVCVIVALCFADERNIEEFLPPEAGASEDDWAFSAPRPYDRPTPETEAMDRALVRGKLDALVADIEAYAEEHGRLPEGLDLLTPAGVLDEGSAVIPEGVWRVPRDPWDAAYVLRVLDGGQFEVCSLGPDGELDTDDDLVSQGEVDLDR